MADDKAKQPEKTGKPAYRVSSLFEVKGEELTRKNQSCPKCGEGTYLAAHSDRLTCGKCGYTEMKSKEAKS